MEPENKTLEELAHETDKQKFTDGFAKLTVDDQKALTERLKAEAVTALDQTSALRAEKQRQEELAAKAIADAQTGATVEFEKRFRSEQQEKAFQEVFTEFGIDKPEVQQQVRSQFAAVDSGKLDAQLIKKDIQKAVVAADPDTFISAWNSARQVSAGADAFKSSMAGNIGGNGESIVTGNNPVDREIQSMVNSPLARKMGLTPEEAKTYAEKGLTREIR